MAFKSRDENTGKEHFVMTCQHCGEHLVTVKSKNAVVMHTPMILKHKCSNS